MVDWFSGIGGFRIGLELTGGFEIVAHSEIDDYAERRVYQQRWPGSLNLGDARVLYWRLQRFKRHGGPDPRASVPDALCWTGGVPCQPASVAGKRLGSDDKRDLWRVFLSLLGAVRPRFVFAENVPGLLSVQGGRHWGRIVRALAAIGYVVEWTVIGAHHVGAPQRRDRLWIWCELADPGRPRDGADQPESVPGSREASHVGPGRETMADPDPIGQQVQRLEEHASEQGPRRGVADGRRTGRRGQGEDVADPGRELPQGEQQAGSATGPVGRGCCSWPPGWALDPADVSHALWIDREPGTGGRGVREGDPELADSPGGGLRSIHGMDRASGGEQSHVAGGGEDVADTEVGTERPGLCESGEAGQRGGRYCNSRCPCCGADQGPTAPLLGRVAHGIPNRVDRLRCLGNAVVPAVVAWIGGRILDRLDRDRLSE